MKSFSRWVFLSLLFTYLVIFAGGLVRVSGAGLGCPDWPKCWGSWLPPTSISQLPPDIDPSTVNLTLAWIEYCNRLIGMTLGIIVLITAIIAFLKHRQKPKVLYPTLLTALLVAYTGWQGGKVVLSELQPIIVSAHMVLALIIISLLIYVKQQVNFVLNPASEQGNSYSSTTHYWILGVWLIAIIQIMLGTQVRTGFEIASGQHPLIDPLQKSIYWGIIKHIHLAIGVLVAVASWGLAHLIFSDQCNPSRFVKQVTVWLSIFVAIQILLGSILLVVGVTPFIQVFHLWTAALFVGALMYLYSAVNRSRSLV